jgi:hypothetical protein
MLQNVAFIVLQMMVAYSVMSTERNPHVILLDFILNPEI